LTYTVQHYYRPGTYFLGNREAIGIGVRALVNGYWGFAAAPSVDASGAERLSREAVAQAAVNAQGAVPRTVDLGQIPVVSGKWATPVAIDPFAVPLEEKFAAMEYWELCAEKAGLRLEPLVTELHFARQERVLVTSEGTRLTQTMYESGGTVAFKPWDNPRLKAVSRQTLGFVRGIETAGKGWELFLDAKIPAQIEAMPDQLIEIDALQQSAKSAQLGRYTLVCDGATMAALLGATLGAATQLDRAMGYEANASGTSFLDDPLGMVGTFQLASPLVSVTANRAAPTQLATVKWDEEGTVPPDVQLVKHGVLTDYQTTREQAAWLAPYYAKARRTAYSNGCAEAEDAFGMTMQHTPNLSLEPGTSAVRVDDLVANVQEGLLVQRGTVTQLDQQARNGLLLSPDLREIKNGRTGRQLSGGAIQFNTLELWKHVIAIGGVPTRMTVPFSQYPWGGAEGSLFGLPVKGEPAQLSSYSVQAAAATIANQALINPDKTA
jgi:TldD protein